VYFKQTIASAVFEEGETLCGKCLKVLFYIEDGQKSLKISDYDVILKQIRNIICFLLGDSPGSEFYMPTFRNSVCSIFIGGQV
jgi:hypothetical protein